MIRLKNIKAGAQIHELEPGVLVRIVTSETVGYNAFTVYYKTNDGALLDRLIYRTYDSIATYNDTFPYYYYPKSMRMDKHPVIAI